MTIPIETYQKLEQIAASFASGTFNLLIVRGDNGLGKSTAFKKGAVGARTIEGQTTAFGLYQMLWHYRDEAIIIDDVDELYKDAGCVRLLKLACQTEPRKRVAWNTATSKLGAEGIPNEFETTSRIAIIANEFRISNKNVEAVANRGSVVVFQPSPEEIHRQAGLWFGAKDDEVYRFVGNHLDQIGRHDQRVYGTALEWKSAGHDWRKYLLQHWAADGDLAALRTVHRDPRLTNQSQRIKRWMAITGKDRSTYYRLAAEHPNVATLRHYGDRPR